MLGPGTWANTNWEVKQWIAIKCRDEGFMIFECGCSLDSRNGHRLRAWTSAPKNRVR